MSRAGASFLGTNQNISGYGIYQRSFVGLKRSMNFITLKTILLAGKTGEATRSGIEKLFEDGLRKCLASLNLG